MNPLAQHFRRALAKAFRHAPLAHSAAPPTLLDWGRWYLAHHFTKPSSLMHTWLATQLDRTRTERGLKINLIGPRGGAKSTVGTLAYVLRAVMEGKEPYIWIISDTKDQARSHLEAVKSELAGNYRLRREYPHATWTPVRWQRSAVELASGVLIEAFGAGQRLRGRRHGEHRPTLIVCDDLQNDSHIASAYQRQMSREWFHGALLKAGSTTTNIINLATALHRDALALELHAAPGWISQRFSAIVEWPTDMPLWREWEALYTAADQPNSAEQAEAFYRQHRDELETGAVLLWPEVEDLLTLMKMRAESGVTAFEREKQGSPVDPERCEWPESYFEDAIWFDEWPDDLTLRTIAIDPSKGRDARLGDYSAIVRLGIDPNGGLYVDADLARRPTPQLVVDGVRHVREFRPDVFGVEANQYQDLLGGEFIAEFARQGVLGVTPWEITNSSAKAVRIRRLGPYLSQRRVRFKRGSPGAKLLVDQLRDFPISAHDDGPDALEMALRLAEEAWRTRDRNDGLGERLIA
jgi:predicted phage terminase large subunit-like protein